MRLLPYNLLHLLRELYMEGEDVRRSIEWLIQRLVKDASRISSHCRYWWVHVASAFPYSAITQWCLDLANGWKSL